MIVFGVGESLGHLLVGEPPIAVGVIEVIATVLKPDPDRTFLFLANQGWVDVSATDVGEAADVTDDFAEEVRSFPSHSEGADAAGTCATNDPLFRVLGQGVGFGDFGKQLGFEHAGIEVAEGVVFLAPVAGAVLFSGGPVLATGDLVGEDTGVDEEGDGHGDLPFVNEVVEDDGRAGLAFFIDIGVAVLEDHHGGGLVGLVLRGHVKVILAEGPCEHLAAQFVPGDLADGHSLLSLRIVRKILICGGGRRGKKQGSEERKASGHPRDTGLGGWICLIGTKKPLPAGEWLGNAKDGG